MKDILKRVLYRILLFIENKTNNAKIFYNTKTVTIGKDSKLYKETVIFNLQKGIDKISIGENSHIRAELVTLNYGGQIEIGDNTFVGVGSRIWSGESVKIGSNVLISHNVNIIDTDSHELNHIERAEGFIKLIKEGYPIEKGSIKTKPIIIGDYVWISFNVIILKGVTIGKGSIIAAGAVVTKDIPEFCLAAGNPAIVIKKIDQ